MCFAGYVLRKSGLVYYETYEQQCLIREIKENMNPDIWLSSGLDTLIAYDRMKNTDYYNTLRCLTRNHFALTVTAAELFIHRNSLQYRITKIEELLGRDLSTPETQFFITLSVLLKEA